MGAPKGNEFWKLRSKHGRDKLFATPDLLWEAACEYFEWCDDNPLLEDGVYGKDPINMNVKKIRAYTIQGLCLYLDCNAMYLRDFEQSLEGKNDDISKDFSLIITRIRQIIYNQKFTGAAAGLLNHNIIARDLGLIEKTDLTSNGKQLPTKIEIEIIKNNGTQDKSE